MPRTYEIVWKKLKNSPDLSVIICVIDPVFLSNIKRMISKEKDMDIGFKMINEVDRYKLKFEWNENSRELTARLVTKYGVSLVKTILN